MSSEFVSRAQAEADGWDLVQQIDADQKALAELGKELEAAHILYRDGRYQVLVAQTKLNSLKDAVSIVKARMYARMAMLKAVPR